MARSSGWFAYSPHGRVTLRRSTGGAQVWARTRDIVGFRQVDLTAGAVCSWAAAWSVDRWRWSRSECGYDLGDLRPEVVADLAAQLDERRIPFRVEVEEYEPGRPDQVGYTRMLDRRHVEVALDRARAR